MASLSGSTGPRSPDDPTLSDDDAQRVLARALELQAQATGRLTVAQIREIASELSIPESAVNQALSEYRAAAEAVHPAHGADTSTPIWTRHRVVRRFVISTAVVGSVVVVLAILRLLVSL
jgi:hypothetical protein